jgi:hypothetical protein
MAESSRLPVSQKIHFASHKPRRSVMSKPNSPKREQYTQKIDPKETGTWVSGITNSEIATLFGTLMSDWVHIEEAMVDLMDILVLPDVDLRLAAGQKARRFLPGQQIFRSMSANGVRAQMMQNLLCHYPGNSEKKQDPIYKRVISEFQSLVNLRNDYLHGLWWTKDNGTVYLQTENLELTFYNRKRRIPKTDFESFIARGRQLTRDIEAIQLKEYRVSDERREALARLKAPHQESRR